MVNAMRPAAVFTCLLLVALAGMLASCASLHATATPYVGAPHFSPSDPTRVEIMRTEPTRPHDRLGEIMVDTSTEPPPPLPGPASPWQSWSSFGAPMPSRTACWR